MANPYRGEVSAKLGDATITLKMTANSWCELEDDLGKSSDEIQSEFFAMVKSGRASMKLMRSYFRACLLHSHQGISLEDAGNIMTELGLLNAAELLGRAIAQSMPAAEEAKPANPPRGRKKGGTG